MLTLAFVSINVINGSGTTILTVPHVYFQNTNMNAQYQGVFIHGTRPSLI